jgi:hypothetical protein
LQLLYFEFCFIINTAILKGDIPMKKLLLITLLIFALLISACASATEELNFVESESFTLDFSEAESSDSESSAPADNAAPPSFTADESDKPARVFDSDDSAEFTASPPVFSTDVATPADSEAAPRADGIIGVPPPAPSMDEHARGGGEPVTDVLWSFEPDDMPMGGGGYSVAPQSQGSNVQTQAGVMTAGEWNDNSNWSFWTSLLGQNGQFNDFRNRWQLSATRRYVVKVVDENNDPIRGAKVSMTGFTAITNHDGIAYVFRALNPGHDFNSPTQFTVTANGETQFAHAAEENIFIFEGAKSPAQLALDLMFVIDTTGSMGDELHYIQTELGDVINNVSRNNANLPIRLSVNFYRDIGDEYVVRPFTFSTDIAAQVRNLNAQNAAGGGDRPEAVDAALQNAIHEHTWNADTVKLMFIVLDAPPHHNQTTVPAMSRLAAEAAEKGIRIIPLLASDGCTETEFLMRSLAIVTGGTYTFVTGHSGISTGRHVEPTIGDYDVEKLNELLINIINRYLS